IWIADFDGATGTVTAKHRLTNIATEADGELWSPDGKNILFKSDVYPECDGAPQAEAECNAKEGVKRRIRKPGRRSLRICCIGIGMHTKRERGRICSWYRRMLAPQPT